MTQTIEQLRARIAELEEENARLVSAIDEHMVVSHIGVFNRGDDPKDALNKIACYEQGIGEYFGKELRDQLAASQAYAEQLRVALIAVRDDLELRMRIAEDDSLNISNSILDQMLDAIDLPRDTSALDAYVANQREAAYREARRAADQFEAELTRQRDLAVEALNAWLGIASNCSIESGCCCCGESIENHSSPMMCGHSPVDMADSVVRGAIQKTDEALSAIKESEGK